MNVYADNAATTAMRESAVRAYVETAKKFYGNPSSLHTVGQDAKALLEDCRAEIAKLLNAKPKEIIFTSGGSGRWKCWADRTGSAAISTRTNPTSGM